MSPSTLDLLLTASRVVCPGTAIDGPGAVGITGGVISFIEASPHPHGLPRAHSVQDFPKGILLPGLVDLHAHPSLEGSRFGVDPDLHLLPRGHTTLLSQGDAGARNIDAYLRRTVRSCRTRVRLALNFCANGESNPGGRFFDISEASVEECVAAVKRSGPDIWGVSVNIAFIRGRDVDPLEVLRRGIRAAELAGRPVMFGATKNSAVPLADQLALLRSGDIMTYCYHTGDGSIIEGGRVLECVWRARERGVLFDVGDGTAAFGFDVAEAAIAEGFLPDTISSDYYSYHFQSGEPHDLPRTVSKLIAAGMTPDQCWTRVTSVPGRILDAESGIGTLRRGAPGDVAVLMPSAGPEPLRDGRGETRTGTLWTAAAVFKDGKRV
jgi:dihydroorotase